MKHQNTLAEATKVALDALKNTPRKNGVYTQEHSDAHIAAGLIMQELLRRASDEKFQFCKLVENLVSEVDSALDYHHDEDDLEKAVEKVKTKFPLSWTTVNLASYETARAAIEAAHSALYNVPFVGDRFDGQHAGTFKIAASALAKAAELSESQGASELALLEALKSEADTYLCVESDGTMQDALDKLNEALSGEEVAA